MNRAFNLDFPSYLNRLSAKALLMRQEHHVKVAASERRRTVRHNIRTPIRIRLWKSVIPEARGESENLSEDGILFATDLVIPLGALLEILLKMPEVITGEPTTEWLCAGRVVRVEPVDSPRGRLGVGVRFDGHQVSRGAVV
jgi:hypothetical protein